MCVIVLDCVGYCYFDCLYWKFIGIGCDEVLLFLVLYLYGFCCLIFWSMYVFCFFCCYWCLYLDFY